MISFILDRYPTFFLSSRKNFRFLFWLNFVVYVCLADSSVFASFFVLVVGCSSIRIWHLNIIGF